MSIDNNNGALKFKSVDSTGSVTEINENYVTNNMNKDLDIE